MDDAAPVVGVRLGFLPEFRNGTPESAIQDSPPVPTSGESGLEAQRHREDRRKENQCCGHFAHGVPAFAKATAGMPWPKFPQPFLKVDKEGEEQGKC